MAYIEVIPDDDWHSDAQLGPLYPKVVDPNYKRVDNIMAVHSLNPQAMSAHQGLYVSAMTGTETLPKVDREMIAMVVSLINHCHY